MESLHALLPFLNWLAGAGAGLLASWLFDYLREETVIPDNWRAFLYTARYARYVWLALSIAVALLATAAAAAIDGRPVLNAVDVAFASVIAGLFRHAQTSLSKAPPEIEYTFEPEE